MDPRIEAINKRIWDLQEELEACYDHGFNFSASQIEDEVERLEKMIVEINKRGNP